MSINVFLSYSLSDSNLVKIFRNEISAKGLQITFLQHSEIEQSDIEWKLKVSEKINMSQGFICLLGHTTWESEAIKWEVEEAIKKNKKIFIIKLKSTVFMIPNYITERKFTLYENIDEKLIFDLKNL